MIGLARRMLHVTIYESSRHRLVNSQIQVRKNVGETHFHAALISLTIQQTVTLDNSSKTSGSRWFLMYSSGVHIFNRKGQRHTLQILILSSIDVLRFRSSSFANCFLMASLAGDVNHFVKSPVPF